MKHLVQCASVPCLLPEDTASQIDELAKTLPQDCRFVVKSYQAELQFEPGERSEVSIISSDKKDYSDEVVLPTGLDLSHFRQHRRVLYNHDRSAPPVAECLWVKTYKNTLRAKTMYPEPKTEDAGPWFTSQLWGLVQAGLLNCKSIGFLPRTPKREPTAEELKLRPDWEGAGIYDNAVLLEYSLVPVPCNVDAVVEFVNQKSLSTELAEEVARNLGVQLPAPPPPPEPAPKPSCCQKGIEAIVKANACVARTIKEMYDSGADKGRSREQIVAIAFSKCRRGKAKKAPDMNKLFADFLNTLSPDPERIARLAEAMYKNRGRV